MKKRGGRSKKVRATGCPTKATVTLIPSLYNVSERMMQLYYHPFIEYSREKGCFSLSKAKNEKDIAVNKYYPDCGNAEMPAPQDHEADRSLPEKEP